MADADKTFPFAASNCSEHFVTHHLSKKKNLCDTALDLQIFAYYTTSAYIFVLDIDETLVIF